MPLLSIAPLRNHWFAVSARTRQHRGSQQRGLLLVKSGFTQSGRFVASAVRRCPTPLCDTLPRRDPLVRPTPLGGHRSSCLSVLSDFSD